MSSASAFAPASVGNVSCGFDIFGFAIAEPGDRVTVTLRDKPGLTIAAISGDGGRLPLDPELNTAGIAIQALWQARGFGQGAEITIEKNLPLSSGLGSSAASAVAAVVAANALLEDPLPKSELLPHVIRAEAAVCGAPHLDNGAPSLLGGFILIRSADPIDLVQIPVPEDLISVIASPDCEIRTKDARSILPDQIPLRRAIRQWGNAAGLIAGLSQGDFGLIGRSLEDVIIEPVRAPLIPGFEAVKAAALADGALGCGISGSGPAVFALCGPSCDPERVAAGMQRAFAGVGMDSRLFISPINEAGAAVQE